MPPEDKSIRQDTQNSMRTEVEEQLANSPPIAAKSSASKELLYEFQVQQIELEMQNEELRKAQKALEESRDRYIDLYDFSPNGYLTLTCDGLINEINLTGAALLGEERNKLVGRRFAPFVASEDGDLWHQHFLRAKNKSVKQSCELTLKRKDGSVLYAKLDSLRMPASPIVFGTHGYLRYHRTQSHGKRNPGAAKRNGRFAYAACSFPDRRLHSA